MAEEEKRKKNRKKKRKKKKKKKKQLSISVVDIPRRARIQILPLSRTVRGLCSVFIQEISNCLSL